MLYRIFAMIALGVARRVAPWAGRRVKQKLAGNDDQDASAGRSDAAASKPASGSGKANSAVSDAKAEPVKS